MAEALLQRRLEQEGLNDWVVESAGTWALTGAPASGYALQLMAERGLDLADHRARELSGSMLEEVNLVLVMTSNHSEALRQEFPGQANKIHMLSEMKDGQRIDVEDPYGGSLERYQTCVDALTDLIEVGLDRIRSLAMRDAP
jgi:protein-tyrosine phosphatase